MFHTEESKDFEAYNGWNFSSPRIWDSIEEGFWYAEGTSRLFETSSFEIGEEEVDRIVIGMIPERFIQVDRNVTSYLFGIIPNGWEDIESKQIVYSANTNVDKDAYVPLLDHHGSASASISVTVDFDFTHRYYKINYYTVVNILSALGGLKASLTPIISYLMPLLALSFFYQMAAII